MIIKANNKIYVLQGSSEDNGQTNNYYITHNVSRTYNIIYDGIQGTITTKYILYLDQDNNTILKRGIISWKLLAGVINSAGVCNGSSDLQRLYNLINEYNIDGVTMPDDDNDDDIINSRANNETETSDNNTDNSDTNLNNTNDRTKSDVIDNTMGSMSQGKDRTNLPAGMSANDSIFANNKFDINETPDSNKGTNIANKGTVYPIIRINEHMFYDDEIQYFSMETGFRKDFHDYAIYKQPEAGFLPTMTLIVNTTNKSIIKQNIIKNGDRCSVFFTTGHKMIKPMRCDFRITNVISNDMKQLNVKSISVTQTIYGELYVPNLRNEKIRYNWNGTSRDGLMDAAKRLKLSFFFCDPQDTTDLMVWCCCKTPADFVKEMTVHAWKDENAFFESWIDPRYGLSFQNINRLLGEDGFDEDIDFTIFNKAFNNYLAADGNKAQYTEEETSKMDAPQWKILSNIPMDIDSMTPYYITSWRLFNNAQAIQDFIGLNCKMQFDSTNAGMDDNSKYAVETSLCINRTKCPEDGKDSKFYVLLGPGRVDTYENADAYMGVSETQNSNNVAPEIVSQPMSDEDPQNILSTDGNMLSSGNTHKFYEVAFQHNMRNLLQLQKQYIVCVLNGANLSIVRGEKLPVVLMDLDKANSYMRSGKSIELSNVLYENESGWYIIDGIEWVFDPTNSNSMGTAWTTHVKLTRREWPIPGITDQKYDNDDLVIVDTGNGGTTVLAYQDAIALYDRKKIKGPYVIDLPEIVITGKATNNNTESETSSGDLDDDSTITEDDKVANSEIPLTGLKDYMKDCYKIIAQEADGKVKLVAARRWAVNENGDKVEGNAFLNNHGYYKCVNALNEILYFKQNNSKHLYGEAFDIINYNGIGFNELMTDIIMKSPAILTHMYNNGLSAYIEQAQDDNGVITKHYHIGTDTTKQKEFWNSVKAVNNKSTIIPGTYIDFSDYTSKNKTTVEIKNKSITEDLTKDEDE